MELKDKSDVFIAHHRKFRATEPCEQSFTQKQLPFVTGVHGTQNVQQSAFSTARFAHDAHKFPFFYFDVDVLKYLHLHGVDKVLLNADGFENDVMAHGVGGHCMGVLVWGLEIGNFKLDSPYCVLMWLFVIGIIVRE
jgi:hypothetical protein